MPQSCAKVWRRGLALFGCLCGWPGMLGDLVRAAGPGPAESRFIDHSLLVAPEYPCTWPAFPFPRFQITHQRTIGRDSAYNIDVLLIDGNTGTQLDVPPHSVARPELKREKSGPLGLAYTDKIEAWQFGGEACVVDVRDLLDQAAEGRQPAREGRARRAVREAASAAAVRRRRAVPQRLLRQVLPAVSRGPPVHRRRARSQGARLIPTPIPTAWSFWRRAA